MKKQKYKKIISLSFLMLAVFLTGCAKGSISEKNTFIDFKRPDFGQPEEQVDIRGLVSSMTGNEVSVLKIERPAFNRDDEKQVDDNNESDEEKKQATIGGVGGGRMPGMGGMRGKMGGNVDEDMKEQMLEKMKEMATGEEKIIIPVGIQMLKPDTDSDSERSEMIEASLEDIKKDVMIQVWLDKSITDRNVAKFVLITR